MNERLSRQLPIVLIGFLVIALGGERCTAPLRSVTMPPNDLPSPRPTRAAVDLGERQKRWPASVDVDVGVPFRFHLYTHCGIDHAIDFDGSFWSATDPDPPQLDDPFAEGVMTLISEDAAEFRSIEGDATVRLERRAGPKVIAPCL